MNGTTAKPENKGNSNSDSNWSTRSTVENQLNIPGLVEGIVYIPSAWSEEFVGSGQYKDNGEGSLNKPRLDPDCSVLDMMQPCNNVL